MKSGRIGIGRRSTLLAVGALALVLLASIAAPASASAAPGEGIEEIGMYVRPLKGSHDLILQLQIYPQRGFAVADITPAVEGPRGVAYAMRIPRAPFDGSIDVRFPGFGRIVGRLVRVSASEPCKTRGAEFEGAVSFRSAGHERWLARRAPAELTPVCAPSETPKGSGRRLLLNAVAEHGPGFSGGSDGPFAFLSAYNPGVRRATELFALTYGRGPGETLLFLVDDYELLGHGVVCNRWLSVHVPRRKQFEIAPGIQFPKSATLRPGGFFSGEATYSRKNHSFLGDLSVHLLGRTVRLAATDAEAKLENQL